jgi:hypothetical protein
MDGVFAAEAPEGFVTASLFAADFGAAFGPDFNFDSDFVADLDFI